MRTNLMILLVVNETTLRDALKGFLEKYGFAVTSAENVFVAFHSKIRELRQPSSGPDLILIDLDAHGPNGRELLEDFAIRWGTGKIPTIFLCPGELTPSRSAMLAGAGPFVTIDPAPAKPEDMLKLPDLSDAFSEACRKIGTAA